MAARTIAHSTVRWEAAHWGVMAACHEAQRINVMINAAVVDVGGNLLAFLRMQGAPLHSASIAIDKAYTVVSFGFATAKWPEVVADNERLSHGLMRRDHLVMLGGGEPIVIEGDIVGAVGVSGASEDEDCA